MKEFDVIPPPPPHLLKIYGASTASYAENKCSTYHRYASALFSASSLYLHRLFAKALILFTAANNLYTAIENHLRSIKVRRRSLVCELAVSSISTYINSG